MRARGKPVPHLRAWQRKKHMNQAELAALAKVTRVRISNLENGDRAFMATIKRLAEALGITREELVDVNPGEE